MTMSCQLYLITPPALPDLDAFAEVFTAALDAGPVACVQLRLKDVSDDDIRAAAKRLCPIAQDRDVAFLINDRPDLAAELGCDGVHIGQEDGTYAEARKIVGPDAIVGVTCHDSRHLAMAAGEAGADYVAFGAFYPTATKEPKTTAEIELLEWWAELFTVPCVAIGGITVDNAKALVDAGADFIAVSAGVWSHPKGAAFAVKTFGELLAE
jgi:thiamine-phosphate pyrophosphorylase